jgi:drug/metabolite transporter (DMT)-like permease
VRWIWAGLLTAAVIMIVIVGNPQAGRSSASLGTWVAVAAVLAPLLVACLVIGRIRGGALAAALFAFVSGSLWGVFAVLTKEVVARLGDGGWAVARTPELYACILAAVGGVVWSQGAFRAGPLTASMPTLQMSQPVVAAVLGVVVLGETLNTGHAGIFALVACGLAATAAIVKLARVEAVATRDGVEARRRDAVGQPV